MPTERFFNLPEEKRERIMQAAVKEVSRVPLHEISINKIAQDAGIARGSFYQYFEDKGDLLMYMLEDYRIMIEKLIQGSLSRQNKDIFEVYTEILVSTIEFGTRKENFAFCKNIFSEVSFKEYDILGWLRDSERELPERLIPYIDKAKFKLQSDEEIVDLLETLVVLVAISLAKVFLNIREKDSVLRSFENKMNMLKYGLLKGTEMESEKNV